MKIDKTNAAWTVVCNGLLGTMLFAKVTLAHLK